MATDFIILVETRNGNKYYVDNKFNLISINNNGTIFNELKKRAKLYSEKSCKRIFTLLHKKYTDIVACNASSLSLYFEKNHTYMKDNIQYVIL